MKKKSRKSIKHKIKVDKSVKTIEEPTKPADNIQKNIAGDVHKNIVDINRLNLIHQWKIAMSTGNLYLAETIKKKLNLPK